MLSIFVRVGATPLVVVNELQALYIRFRQIKRSVKKRNTARSANLDVLVYTLLYRKVLYCSKFMVHCRKRIAWLLLYVERNAAGVDSAQAQGMVSCRTGIVRVDCDQDGLR